MKLRMQLSDRIICHNSNSCSPPSSMLFGSVSMSVSTDGALSHGYM